METALHSVRKENDSKHTMQSKEKDVRVEQFVTQIQELEATLKETSE